jgi:hypothetical protein
VPVGGFVRRVAHTPHYDGVKKGACRRGTLIEEPAHRQMDNPLAVTIPGKLVETANGGEVLRIARWLEFPVSFGHPFTH